MEPCRPGLPKQRALPYPTWIAHSREIASRDLNGLMERKMLISRQTFRTDGDALPTLELASHEGRR